MQVKLPRAMLLTVGFSLLGAMSSSAALVVALENETYNSVTIKFEGLPQDVVTNPNLVVDWDVGNLYGDFTSSTVFPGVPDITLGMQRAGVGVGFAYTGHTHPPDPNHRDTLALAYALNDDTDDAGIGVIYFTVDDFSSNQVLPVSGGIASSAFMTTDQVVNFSRVVNGTNYSGTASYQNVGRNADNDEYFGTVTYTIPGLPNVPEPSSSMLLGVAATGLLLRRRRG